MSKSLIEVRNALKHIAAKERLATLIETCTLLEGKKGKGKSVSSVAIAHNMNKLFGMPVVSVGTSAGLKPTFGDFQYLNEMQFIDELDKLTTISKAPDDELEAAIDVALKNIGVSLYGSIMLFDEAYKLFDCRTPSDKVVRVFGYFIAQQRHYHVTSILLSPTRSMIDKRVRAQVDWYGRCFHNKYSDICTVYFRGGLETWPLRINCKKYYPMYDSWAILGYRRKHLEINSI